MKNTIISLLFLPLVVFADTPPPGTVKAKTFSGDGNTAITATGTALDVNVRYTPINSLGSQVTGNVSTAITLSAPANASGFVLQAKDSNGANIRWAVGAAASASVGQQLQPGRDSGFVPLGANVSVCSESGTNEYEIQWVLTH